MFTGLIEELAIVKDIRFDNQGSKITITSNISEFLKVGDSVSVNGVCLTIIHCNQNNFTVEVIGETLSKTNLSLLAPNQKVNLERALLLSDRIAGHLVTGHVDEVGVIINKIKIGLAVATEISASENLLSMVVSKGSIAVDGISLTVVEVKELSFSVHLIPHTLENTTLSFKGVGSKVNLESDILAKYVSKMLSLPSVKGNVPKTITEEYLIQSGF
ncbi:MAG: Riboflavin synthase [candidate division WS2 bacterium]|uniref:Riboflavin synthase n=1 Tax=Psychracetigena formicireducens TaxID=2986056 RepID=A0A9E2F3W0_PSYF1|nr:Riboflavin synthase [Candidatus Psychracetigena formicireducens]MBT9144326.1 Riboflavin synthase [Candidatus Psychracetigena formicireducens]